MARVICEHCLTADIQVRAPVEWHDTGEGCGYWRLPRGFVPDDVICPRCGDISDAYGLDYDVLGPLAAEAIACQTRARDAAFMARNHMAALAGDPDGRPVEPHLERAVEWQSHAREAHARAWAELAELLREDRA